MPMPKDLPSSPQQHDDCSLPSSTFRTSQSSSGRTNALAETINGLYKTELIKPRKPWRTIEEVELATAEPKEES
jgi:hypothetical protein